MQIQPKIEHVTASYAVVELAKKVNIINASQE
jgi:hypothetical protein